MSDTHNNYYFECVVKSYLISQMGPNFVKNNMHSGIWVFTLWIFASHHFLDSRRW